MIRASARCFLVFCGANRFIFLTQTISCNKNILVDQYVFPKKDFPERSYQELSNCQPFPLCRWSNEYSKSTKTFCLILEVEKLMYFVLAPFSRRLLFRDQTFSLFRRFWVFWIVCRICEILECSYCVVSSAYCHVFTRSAWLISCKSFMQILNNRGPNTDPWGTSNDTVLSQIWNRLLEHIAIYFQGNW